MRAVTPIDYPNPSVPSRPDLRRLPEAGFTNGHITLYRSPFRSWRGYTLACGYNPPPTGSVGRCTATAPRRDLRGSSTPASHRDPYPRQRPRSLASTLHPDPVNGDCGPSASLRGPIGALRVAQSRAGLLGSVRVRAQGAWKVKRLVVAREQQLVEAVGPQASGPPSPRIIPTWLAMLRTTADAAVGMGSASRTTLIHLSSGVPSSSCAGFSAVWTQPSR
jgi:hypothetical protein